MNTNLILIKISDYSYNDIIRFLLKRNIFYKDLTFNGNVLTLIVKFNDFKKIKREIENVKIVKYLGVNGFLSWLKRHSVILLSFILSYGVLLALSNVIFDIEIVTSNQELKRVISLYLEDYNIKKYKFMKSNKELEKLKEEILSENKNTLEWIEFERVGTKYTINLTERIVNEKNGDAVPSDIVASKDATILYMVTKSGTRIKDLNEVVKKGEVLISGNIMKDENLVNQVEADGEVFGETWYTVTTTVPFSHVEYEKTGTTINHIYINIFGKKLTLMGKYETNESMNTTTVLLDKPYLFFNVMKEQKELYKYVTHNLNEDEAYEEALKRSDKGIENSLDVGEYIIDKKVLKKNVYSSKIEVEVFYKVYESIGEKREIINESVEGE